MSVICVGGCCVPYTAVVPLAMLFFKWCLDKLNKIGFFKFIPSLAPAPPKPFESSSFSCCQPASAPSITRSSRKSTSKNFITIESMEEWEDLCSESLRTGAPIIADFTASWCKPVIAPFFEQLASNFDATFVKIDVDELDELAEKANVAMMPTFAVYIGSNQIEKIAGANEPKLERMITSHASRFSD